MHKKIYGNVLANNTNKNCKQHNSIIYSNKIGKTNEKDYNKNIQKDYAKKNMHNNTVLNLPKDILSVIFSFSMSDVKTIYRTIPLINKKTNQLLNKIMFQRLRSEDNIHLNKVLKELSCKIFEWRIKRNANNIPYIETVVDNYKNVKF